MSGRRRALLFPALVAGCTCPSLPPDPLPERQPYNLCGVTRSEHAPPSTWDDPLPVPHLPMVDRHQPADPRRGAAVVDTYDCAPGERHPGRELVYRFSTIEEGDLQVWIENAQGFLLAQPPRGRAATGCLARGEEFTRTDLPAGDWWLAVEPDGDGLVEVAFQAWGAAVEVPLAPGVVWSRRLLEASDGAPQVVNTLRVEPGVSVKPRAHPDCGTVPATASAMGAIAGVNGGFFSETCQPLCLLKVGGELLGTNKMASRQRAVGWAPPPDSDSTGPSSGAPASPHRVDWIPRGADWAEVVHGVGGFPSLVEGGEPKLEPERSSSFFQLRHPRTAAGFGGDGELIMVTVDGRTAASAGATMVELAEIMVDAGAVDAVNLDGGGSTTMFVRDCWLGGVVSLPSDNLRADQRGVREVSDGLYVLEQQEDPR